jgi:hypothetical protein
MQCSARLQTVPAPATTGDRAPTAKASRRLALQAAVVGSLLMLPLAAFSDRDAAAQSAEQAARLCAALDDDAEDAIARRLRQTEAARPDIVRTAQNWLAEARRQCSGGDPERAGLLYQRIIAAGDFPG